MALTVCSAISVSAAPASAQPQQQTNTVQTSPSAYCTVHVGTNELWTGWQYNYHEAYGFIEAGTGTHTERSVFNALSTNLAWQASSVYSETSVASVGVQFRLAGKITPQQWPISFPSDFWSRLPGSFLLLSVWLEHTERGHLSRDDPVSIVVSLIITCVAQFTT